MGKNNPPLGELQMAFGGTRRPVVIVENTENMIMLWVRAFQRKRYCGYMEHERILHKESCWEKCLMEGRVHRLVGDVKRGAN